MIVVVGVPAWRAAEPAAPAGRACEAALEAARHGSRVELVGRTGDDAAGDALLAALAEAGVGHAAMLRDPVRATRIVEAGPPDDDVLLRSNGHEAGPPRATRPPADAALGLDAADVALGLEYLAEFTVLLVTDDVPDAAVLVAVEAAGFAGARLVLLVSPGGVVPASLPADATVLAAPAGEDEGAFAALVGAYAAALDGGLAPGEAFAVATGDAGWEALSTQG